MNSCVLSAPTSSSGRDRSSAFTRSARIASYSCGECPANRRHWHARNVEPRLPFPTRESQASCYLLIVWSQSHLKAIRWKFDSWVASLLYVPRVARDYHRWMWGDCGGKPEQMPTEYMNVWVYKPCSKAIPAPPRKADLHIISRSRCCHAAESLLVSVLLYFMMSFLYIIRLPMYLLSLVVLHRVWQYVVAQFEM